MRKECNPALPKATDPRYECNPRTGRWIKKKTDIIAYPPFGMSKKNWIQIIEPYIPDHRELTRQEILRRFRALFQRDDATEPWSTTCARMEKECPMDCDLETNPWCSFENDTGIFFWKHDGVTYCYRYNEIFQNLHREFTALDTSYQIPPLRLKIPSDPFTRRFLPPQFFEALLAKIRADTSYKITTDFPEVLYFLKHYRELYAQRQTFASLNPVAMSQMVETFLLQHPDIQYRRTRDREIQWVFRPRKKPRDARRYIFS